MNRYGVIAAVIIIAIMAVLSTAQADNNKKAKALYFAAEDAYAAKKYDEALTGIKAVERLLGSSNALLQGLRVKSLFGKGDFEGTKKAWDKFFTMEASDDLSREIAPYMARAEKGIADRKKARASAAAAARRKAAAKAKADKLAARKRAAAAKREADKKAAAQAKLEAQKKSGLLELTFGGPKEDRAHDITAMPDGGFAFAGRKMGRKRLRGWVVRTDAFGAVKWQKTIGKSVGTDEAMRIATYFDGGVIVAGHSSVDGRRTGWIERYGPNGRRLWDVNLPNNKHQTVESLAVMPDGGFVVAVYRYWSQATFIGQVFKYDANGRLIWETSFKNNKQVYAQRPIKIAALPDGGLVIAGKRNLQAGSRRNDAWIARLDPNGGLLWEKDFGAAGDEQANGLVAEPGGGVIVAGETYVDATKKMDAWVFRLDGTGRMLWQQTFGDNYFDAAKDIAVLPNGKVMVVGMTGLKGPWNGTAWLLQLDVNGQVLATKPYGGRGSENVRSLTVLPEGWAAFAGSTEAIGAGETDAWVILSREL